MPETITVFFCEACLIDKPATEVSPDPRYCQGCCDFLVKEAMSLPDHKRSKWVPKLGKENQYRIPDYGDVIMSTVLIDSSASDASGIINPQGKKFLLGKRGPKHKPFPEDLIRQLATEKGMDSKRISARLFNDHGIEISYRTILRILSGQRVLMA